jgi:peptidoglycan/xylan/chitin deacetylase (PgdA/CDA1 family)
MLAKQNARSIPILMYHSISQPAGSADPSFKALCISPALFTAQVEYLYHSKYTFITVNQLTHAIKGESPFPDRPVVLTFDDGYADFYHHALPVLSHYRLAATLYIVTGFVGRTSLWLRSKRETGHPILTWNQIAEISNSGIECGGHTQSHPKLDALPLAIARNEIKCSKDLLEQHLSREVTSFAYPYGYYTSSVRRLVKEVGFTSACAIKNCMSSDKTDLFTLERLAITPDMDISAFDALLNQEKYSELRKMYMRTRIPVKHALRCCTASLSRFYLQLRGNFHQQA